MSPKYAAKKDTNHNEIQDALTRAGARCMDTSAFGMGFVDIVALVRGVFYMLEVKSGNSGLTEHEKIVHALFDGGHIHIVRTVDEALAVCGLVEYNWTGEGVA